MPSVWLSSDPYVQRVHHKFDIFSPASCGAETVKLENARRQLKALKAERERLSKKDPKEWRSGAILAATLIKETCYSFIDLAGALAATVMGPGGKKVEAWSKGLTGVMDMTDALANGKGIEGVGKVAISTGLDLAGSTKAGEAVAVKTSIFKGQQGMNLVGLKEAERAKDKRETGFKMRSIVYDSGGFVSELAEDGLPQAKYLKSGLAVVKAADRYSMALEKAIDEYFAADLEDLMRRTDLQVRILKEIGVAEQLLQQALDDFSACMRQ